MNTNEIAKEYRMHHWSQIMQDRINSGMSITQYCKTAGFHPNIYYYWQRKLRKAACEELSIKTQNNIVVSKQSPVPSGWAICERTAENPTGKILPIEINGCRIMAEKDTDMDLLKNVCRALVGL